MQNNYNQQHHSDHSTTVQTELLKIFMDLTQYEEKVKDKAKAQRKLAARRAIEQHFEKKELEEMLVDSWND